MDLLKTNITILTLLRIISHVNSAYIPKIRLKETLQLVDDEIRIHLI